MSDFTLTLIKLAFLAVLWLFVIAAVGVIRADLFGSKAATKAATRAAQPPRPPKAGRPQMAAAPPPPSRRGAQGGAPSKLVVVQGERAGTVIDLTGVPITIGRANDATLVVTDDYASSRHARLYAQDGQWIVEDLGSTNGTYLGRTKVTRPMPVPPGVPVRIGKTVIELRK
ncbi:FHA domain-containing protein [Actinomadura sp. LD22]|jgi:pSer/pThr/pTyr-binding forkhead associated (FHA) protein|uniref:FHA domain-containing protein n=3 Tax=Actinomadura TaxID=1988 RepID=A0A6I4M6R2_9ACTN|nr:MULTISPECIES: FHA domain-containing protein [Actinomadura]KAB2379483.1 FHA domain-containing protein [Actinomadura montaniterrae]MWA01463.1 FHA domain-containing protein [Actinomadura physcomitrii]HEU5030396.1 FHA domain-containing protein [Spirillospora sp.]